MEDLIRKLLGQAQTNQRRLLILDLPGDAQWAGKGVEIVPGADGHATLTISVQSGQGLELAEIARSLKAGANEKPPV